jgi:aspartokinase
MESPRTAPVLLRETAFEKKRGVSKIEVRRGFAQVHVSGITESLVSARLRALKAVGDIGVSIDFLKLTPSGLSFMVPERAADIVRSALEGAEMTADVHSGRSIVLVHAVNMRDEEGLISRVIQAVIGTGTAVDHVGDMHDRLLLVVKEEDAERVARRFEESLIPESPTR